MTNIFINLWQAFCQYWADINFYKGLKFGFASEQGGKLLDKYNVWIDRKFMFDKKGQ